MLLSQSPGGCARGHILCCRGQNPRQRGKVTPWTPMITKAHWNHSLTNFCGCNLCPLPEQRLCQTYLWICSPLPKFSFQTSMDLPKTSYSSAKMQTLRCYLDEMCLSLFIQLVTGLCETLQPNVEPILLNINSFQLIRLNHPQKLTEKSVFSHKLSSVELQELE